MVGASQLCALPILAAGVRHVANRITDSGRTDQRPSQEHRHLFRWYRPTGRGVLRRSENERLQAVPRDASCDPARQLAFYDPGSDGSIVTRVYRTIWSEPRS
jgi:hypothetical protein